MYFSKVSDLGSQVDSLNDTLDSFIKTSLLGYLSPTVDWVLLTLQSAGYDFSTLQDSATITIDPDTRKIAHTGSGVGTFWVLNYSALVSLVNGQYYVEYFAVFGMMGIPEMSEATWNKITDG